MKKIFLFLILVSFSYSQATLWKIVGSKVYLANKFWTLSMREGMGTGMQLGYVTSGDSGSVRYYNGTLQYYDGGAWRTVGYSGDPNSFSKPQIDTVGTVVSGTWHANTITTSYGGTGLTSYTQGDIPYYNSGTAFSKLALGSSNQILGVSNAAPTIEYKTLATTAIGTDFTISYSGSTVNFNLPTATASARGALSSADWTTFNNKKDQTDSVNIISGYMTLWQKYLDSLTTVRNERSNSYPSGTTQTMPRASILHAHIDTITATGNVNIEKNIHLYGGNDGTSTAKSFQLDFIGNPATENKYQGLFFYVGGLKRWSLLKDSIYETGSAVGSNFEIHVYDDAGVFSGIPLKIIRSTGDINTTGVFYVNETAGSNAPIWWRSAGNIGKLHSDGNGVGMKDDNTTVDLIYINKTKKAIQFYTKNVLGAEIDSNKNFFAYTFVGTDSLRGKAGTITYWNKVGSHGALGTSYMGALDVLSLFARGKISNILSPTAANAQTFTTSTAEGGGLWVYDGSTTGFLPRLVGYSNNTGANSLGFQIEGRIPTANDVLTASRAVTMFKVFLDSISTTAVSNANAYLFQNGSTDLLTISSAGNVGIRTISPDSALTVEFGAHIKRNLLVDGTISSGAITSTGLSTFGTNSDTVLIQSNGIGKKFISGLTTSGKVSLGINKNGFVTVSDTLPSWYIPNTDTLYVRYKFNEVVSFWVGKK